MKEIRSIICDPEDPQNTLHLISDGLEAKAWMQLISKNEKKILIPKERLPIGPGVIISSGGSSGRSRKCLIPFTHLNQSAMASANWIKSQGIDTKNCQIFNSLPLNHISGLMAWWRSRCWYSQYVSITPSLMRNPNSLEKRCLNLGETPKITSLVPTQVARLLKEPAGVRWLQSFSIIWLGGSFLTDNLSSAARSLNIQLAPCYGATETTAMIAVQSPKNFLLGNNKYSTLLEDIEVKLGENNRLEVKTTRLAKAEFINEQFKPITNNEGWWESGDAAELIESKLDKQLRIIGRIDTAINSGGETVYPDILQIRLLNTVMINKLPIEECFLMPTDDKEWGQRLIALVRFCSDQKDFNESQSFVSLKKIVTNWAPYERPVAWYNCPTLKKNAAGKWEYEKWKLWLKKNQK